MLPHSLICECNRDVGCHDRKRPPKKISEQLLCKQLSQRVYKGYRGHNGSIGSLKGL